MFYHGTLWFDYEGFAAHVRPLAQQVEQGQLEPLRAQVVTLLANTPPEQFALYDYGMGGMFKSPPSIAEVQQSAYRNSIIGDWFTLLLSTYLQRGAPSLGFWWWSITNALAYVGWTQAAIDHLTLGLPVGRLVSPAAAQAGQVNMIEHTDPYWRWIRPSHSSNQGGWLALEDCHDLRAALRDVPPHFIEVPPPDDGQYVYTEEFLQRRRNMILQQYEQTMAMVTSAIDRHCGLYMVVLHDWEEDDEDDE